MERILYEIQSFIIDCNFVLEDIMGNCLECGSHEPFCISCIQKQYEMEHPEHKLKWSMKDNRGNIQYFNCVTNKINKITEQEFNNQ